MSTLPWPTASGTAVICTQRRQKTLLMPWRSSPTPRRKPSLSVCGRRGPCVSDTTWACIHATWRGCSPGGAPGGSRGAGRATSVRPWARSTPSERRDVKGAVGLDVDVTQYLGRTALSHPVFTGLQHNPPGQHAPTSIAHNVVRRGGPPGSVPTGSLVPRFPSSRRAGRDQRGRRGLADLSV